VLRVRYRFTGHLAPAARAVIDPERLTWVDESHHDLAARTVRFTLHPDHYGDRFAASGGYRFEPDGADDGATIRTAWGDVKVKAPLVGGAVERAIVSGLEEHLRAETAIVERFLGVATD
jgi:hypothetical protein